MYSKSLCLIFLILLSANVGNAALYQAGSFDPVRENQESWTCVDTAINYAREHPEWGVVTMSNNPVFVGKSHMVNYRIADGVFCIYDANLDLRVAFDDPAAIRNYNEPSDVVRDCNYQSPPTYFHIWQRNETPLRNYKHLKDNLEEYYKAA